MPGLSKSKILANCQCPKRLWLQSHQPELAEEDKSSASRMAAGDAIGEVARALVPDGILIDEGDLSAALRQTQAVLALRPRRPLFEATFEYSGVLIRADLLIPEGQRSYQMVEVKSSTEVKDYYFSDAAVQAWVARNAGVNIGRVEVAHVNNRFIYPGRGRYEGLLTHVDVKREINALAPQITGWVDAARMTVTGSKPKIPTGAQCTDPFPCPFHTHCRSSEGHFGIPFPVSSLPRDRKLVRALEAEGFRDLRDVPPDRFSRPAHKRMLDAINTGRAFVSAELEGILNNCPYPHRFVDFESVNPALPIWPGTRPYAQIPFQWSCHVQSRPGAEVEHQDFLAGTPDDPRREFTESLVQVLGDSGTVFVYNAGFEKARMREMAEIHPEHAGALRLAMERIVDLLPLAREHYYHPDMQGSWSIKFVLPTVAPDLAYDDLVIAGGSMAQDAYVELLRTDLEPDRRSKLRGELLEYCKRDTLALVRVVHFFAGRKADVEKGGS